MDYEGFVELLKSIRIDALLIDFIIHQKRLFGY